MLAKDIDQRSLIRREFRRQLPPLEERKEGKATSTSDADTQEAAATDATAGQAGPHPPSASTPTKPVVLTTPHARRRPVWRLALGGAVLAVVATLLAAWFWFREPPSQAVSGPPRPVTAPPPTSYRPTPIRYFHDWIPVIEPLDQTAVLSTWLPLLALSIGGYSASPGCGNAAAPCTRHTTTRSTLSPIPSRCSLGHRWICVCPDSCHFARAHYEHEVWP